MDGLEVETIRAKSKLEQLIVKDGSEAEKKIRSIIRKVLTDAAKNLGKRIQPYLGNDPRQSYKAVRSSIYRQILGGNLNILQGKRRKGNVSSGGSTGKRQMSDVTRRFQLYSGEDRGFILRFLNSGTEGRFAKNTYNNKPLKDSKYILDARSKKKRKGGFKTQNEYDRGSIKPRNFFGATSNAEMKEARALIEEMIDKYIREEFAS